ncbi:MAG: hypothetical protein ABI742_05865 [Gemmatimonadota bacterium]
MRLPLRVGALILPFLVARQATAQLPIFAAGFAGAGFDVGTTSPNSGGGFSYQAEIGLRFRRLTIGGEFGQHDIGGDRKARLIGAFVRLGATTTGQVRPYLVLGFGDYRYSPSAAGKTRALGGNAGLGVLFPIGGNRAGVLLEARYHSAFDGVGSISSREFASVVAGLQLGF